MGYRPWPELTHPGGATLDDLKLHVGLVSETVGPADNVFGFQIRGLHVTQGNFLVAEGQDSVQVFFDPLGKLPHGLHAGPLQLIHPLPEKAAGACPGLVAPEMAEGFFEQMRFQEFRACGQEIVQGLAGFPPHVSEARKQDELLAGQEASKPLSGALFELGFTNIIHRIQEVADHMELVVNDLNVRTMGLEAVSERGPHVHHHVCDAPGAVFSKPLPELPQTLLPTPFHNVQQFGTSGPLRDTNHRPIVLASPHGDFVGSHDRDAVQGTFRLNLRHRAFVDLFDGSPVHHLEEANAFIRHDLAQLRHQAGQPQRDARSPHVHELQGFCPDPATRTVHPISLKPQKTKVMPQHQMLNLLPRAVIALFHRLAALPACVPFYDAFHVNHHRALTLMKTGFQAFHTKSLRFQQRCKTIFWHLMRPPYLKNKEFTASDASFIPTLSRHEPFFQALLQRPP